MDNKSVSFEIDGVIYKTPANINEIQIGRFVKFLDEVLQDIPEELENVYPTAEELDEGVSIGEKWAALSDKDKSICYTYFAKYLEFWTGAPYSGLMKQGKEKITLAFWIIEIMIWGYKADENFNSFEIKGKKYFIRSEHMKDETLIEFAECAQFQENTKALKGGQFSAMLDIMAILCRPEGEEYDEKRSERRKVLFSSLPLSTGLNVIFFLHRLNIGLSQTLSIYTLMQYKAEAETKLLTRLMGGTRF